MDAKPASAMAALDRVGVASELQGFATIGTFLAVVTIVFPTALLTIVVFLVENKFVLKKRTHRIKGIGHDAFLLYESKRKSVTQK